MRIVSHFASSCQRTRPCARDECLVIQHARLRGVRCNLAQSLIHAIDCRKLPVSGLRIKRSCTRQRLFQRMDHERRVAVVPERPQPSLRMNRASAVWQHRTCGFREIGVAFPQFRQNVARLNGQNHDVRLERIKLALGIKDLLRVHVELAHLNARVNSSNKGRAAQRRHQRFQRQRTQKTDSAFRQRQVPFHLFVARKNVRRCGNVLLPPKIAQRPVSFRPAPLFEQKIDLSRKSCVCRAKVWIICGVLVIFGV